MGKVVTSEGLTEFVQSGKFTQVTDHKPGETPKLETVAPTPTLDVKPADKPAEKPAEAPKEAPKPDDPDNELTAEEKALPEKAQKEIQRSKRAVNEKHKAMKEAQEAAAEAERFAENLYNERRLATERAEAAEARLKELEAKTTPKEPELKEPNRADFTDAAGNLDWEKYTDAKADYRAKLAIKEERERVSKETAEAQQNARIEALRTRADKAREAHPDFDEVMSRVKGTDADKVPNFVLSYIQESENSAEIAYHLAKHPEVSQRISKLKPILGIAELGKLEDTLVKPPSEAAKVPAADSVTPIRSERGGAPAPITPLNGEGTTGINTDPSKMSYKELRAYHRAREAEKRRR